MRTRILSLAPLSGLRIGCCHELWCRLQMRLRSRVAMAVAVVGSCSSDWIPSQGTSICFGCGPKKKKKKETDTLRVCVALFKLVTGRGRIQPWQPDTSSLIPHRVMLDVGVIGSWL